MTADEAMPTYAHALRWRGNGAQYSHSTIAAGYVLDDSPQTVQRAQVEVIRTHAVARRDKAVMHINSTYHVVAIDGCIRRWQMERSMEDRVSTGMTQCVQGEDLCGNTIAWRVGCYLGNLTLRPLLFQKNDYPTRMTSEIESYRCLSRSELWTDA